MSRKNFVFEKLLAGKDDLTKSNKQINSSNALEAKEP
jgi:hypothetical protein